MGIHHRKGRKPPASTSAPNDPKRGKRPRTVSASELAQLGVCERRVVFEHRLGKRRTSEQREACRRGELAHERFFREGVQTPAAEDAFSHKGFCFIATLVYGETPETQVLRQFRDRVLRPTRPGRWAIAAYYRMAPSVCTVLKRHPGLQRVVRIGLAPLVWLARHLAQGK